MRHRKRSPLASPSRLPLARPVPVVGAMGMAAKAAPGKGGGKGKRGNLLSTTTGTTAGVCLRHCIRGLCDKPECGPNPAKAGMHPAARLGHGILPSECAQWPSCPRESTCSFGLRCIWKHGDGHEQLASKHGSRSVQSNLANVSQHPEPPPGTSAGLPTTQGEGLSGAQVTALLASAREGHQSMRELTAAVNAIITGPPGAIMPRLLSLLSALPDMCSPQVQLTAALSQVGTSALISNEGRRAASFFTSRGEHLGQALDSGGSDHIAGQRDARLAYKCMAPVA